MSHKYLSILTAILILGCANVEFNKPLISIHKQMPTGIQDGEAIVVLSDTKTFWGGVSDFYFHEQRLGKGISNAIKKLNRRIEVFSSEEFRRIFFSNLDLSDDYQFTWEAFDPIFMNQEILKRIESFNIHYIVLVSVYKSYSEDRDYGWLLTRHNRREATMFQGRVFDISKKCRSGEISTDVAGEDIITTMYHAGSYHNTSGAFGIPSEREAFKIFCEEVAKFLVGKEKNE